MFGVFTFVTNNLYTNVLLYFLPFCNLIILVFGWAFHEYFTTMEGAIFHFTGHG